MKIYREFCLAKLQGVNVYLELTEYFEIIELEKLKNNFIRLKEAGDNSLDDFGKDFARSDLIIALVFNQIKIDMRSQLWCIEDDYGSFKHLSFVTEKIVTGHHNIVFEGIETEKQKNLIVIFCDDAIFQGYFFAKPMKLEDIFQKFKPLTEPLLKKQDDKEDQIKKLDFYKGWLLKITAKVADKLKTLIFSNSFIISTRKTIENYKNVYNTKI